MTGADPWVPSTGAPHGYEPELWDVRVTIRRPARVERETAQLRYTVLPHDLATLRELVEHPTDPDGRSRVLTLYAIGPADPQPQAWLVRADQRR